MKEYIVINKTVGPDGTTNFTLAEDEDKVITFHEDVVFKIEDLPFKISGKRIKELIEKKYIAEHKEEK